MRLLRRLKQYLSYEKRLKAIYGEHEGLLETVISTLERYENSSNSYDRLKSRLLTDEDADMWEAYKKLGTPEEIETALLRLYSQKGGGHEEDAGENG